MFLKYFDIESLHFEINHKKVPRNWVTSTATEDTRFEMIKYSMECGSFCSSHMIILKTGLYI